MKKAVVKVPICPLKADPDSWAAQPDRSCLDDEVLLGMIVELTGEEKEAPAKEELSNEMPAGGSGAGKSPWVHVTTDYGYSGWAPKEALVLLPDEDTEYFNAPKATVYYKHFADVLKIPKVQGAFVMQDVPMGAVLRTAGEPEGGWQKVSLPDGREGYVFAGVLRPYLPPYLAGQFSLYAYGKHLDRYGSGQQAGQTVGSGITSPEQSICAFPRKEAALRRAVTDAARLYAGSHYRWAGKTPAGIDCSGLCSMAYLLNGIAIYRDADIREGFPVHTITREQMKEGDLLFFPGHVGMYLGDGMYIHSTARAGSDGVTINSLEEGSPLYRQDLAEGITMIGSIF